MHLSFFARRPALLAAVAALILPLAPHAAFAQADDVTGAGAGVGVARISLIEGSVAVQRGDATTPSAAVVNAPVLGGDFLTTGDASRAEVQIDGGTLVRLGENAQLRFTHLDTDARAMQLAEGTIDLRLLRGTDGSSDIDTPSVTVRPRAGGSYRVTVTTDGRTLVTVRSGDAAIVTPQGDQALAPGTTLVAEGPSSNPAITTQDVIALDDFDRFNQDRDAGYQQALADDKYVSPDIVGAADLSTNGRWVDDPTYGQSWVPSNVAPDWTPYSDGRWVWEASFGWTWVGNEPWGWAPYHYGAWYHSPDFGWAWSPPPMRSPAVWRPAMVAFVSFGGGAGIGWVPLAPFEPYHAWWGPSWGNRTTIVNNNYGGGNQLHNFRNAQYGVVTTPGRRFTDGQFGRPTIVRPNELRDAQVVRGAVPVVPSAASLRYSDRPVAPQLSARAGFAQRTFAGDTTSVRRTQFDQTRSGFSGMTQRTATQPAAGASRSGAAGDPWARFNGARGTAGVAATNGQYNARPRQMDGARPSYANGASGSYNATGRAYGSYGAPVRTNGSYSAPARAYGQYNGSGRANGSYSAPGRANGSYSAPGRANGSYSAPGRANGSYSAPGRAYGSSNASGRAYSAPGRTYGSYNGSARSAQARPSGQARQATARSHQSNSRPPH